jgi:hypothetical protein
MDVNLRLPLDILQLIINKTDTKTIHAMVIACSIFSPLVQRSLELSPSRLMEAISGNCISILKLANNIEKFPYTLENFTYCIMNDRPKCFDSVHLLLIGCPFEYGEWEIFDYVRKYRPKRILENYYPNLSLSSKITGTLRPIFNPEYDEIDELHDKVYELLGLCQPKNSNDLYGYDDEPEY